MIIMFGFADVELAFKINHYPVAVRWKEIWVIALQVGSFQILGVSATS